MTSSNLIPALIVFSALAGFSCSKDSDSNGTGSNPANGPTIANLPNGRSLTPLAGVNIVPITVNGSLCSASTGYPNKPCASVTICTPGVTPSSATCDVINDILVDTGSYGLRVFSTVLSNSHPTPINASTGKPLAECAQFGSGSDWGQVETASVILGGEPAVEAPIQVINSSYATYPGSCGSPDSSPGNAGFNGILGVGLFAADCGTTCAGSANNGTYYSCDGSTCTGVAAATTIQVTNPVALLKTDNNGVIIELPSIPDGGVSTVNGYLVLGIGTQTNNAPTGVTAYAADQNAEFKTSFGGSNNQSFVDSGSNGLFFTSPGDFGDCVGANSSWFCPPSTVLLSALSTSATGSPNVNMPFLVGNTDAILNTGNNVFSELAGDAGGDGSFDWGLPFYLGRNIYVGIETKTSTLGTGPYWAF